MKKHSKFIASAAAITLAASAIAPVATEAASFSDIKGHTHENAIISLVDLGIINGYPDGTFKPNQSLSRSDVVKLLGKYLVSLGHKVPTDYKTKMRFTDLTAKSQDELLQYAALVKDVGVFNGSNGKLMHKDEIRRDQMATVLVRAFKVINDYDYIAHVKEQDYKSTIKDLSKTTAEHQEAINVFAYYGVTKQPTFSPKDVTKRGQFASFLFNMLKVETPNKTPEVPEAPALTIKTVEVQANNKLRVVLSDDKAYIVTLKTPLVENIATEVSFEIGEKTYKTTVTYVVPDLKVVSVKNDNGSQIKIEFNQPVKLEANLDTVAITKLVSLTGIDKTGVVQLSKGELSEDKRTLTVTTNSNVGLEGRYRIVVDGITSQTGKTLVKYDDIVGLVVDKTPPAVATVENVSASKVKVKFTEPINNSVGTTRFTLVDGSVVTGITGTIGKNATEVIYDLSNAIAKGYALDAGTTVVVTFGTILDLANNLSSPNPLTTYVTKGNKDGVVPTLVNTTQLGAKKFKLTFSEELRAITPSDLSIAYNSISPGIISVEVDPADAKSYIVTTNQFLTGLITIATAPGKYITDQSGEVNVFSTAFNFMADTAQPKVVSSAVVSDLGVEYLEFTFDRNVDILTVGTVQIAGSFVSQGYTYDLQQLAPAQLKKHEKNDKVMRVKLSDLVGSNAAPGTAYYVTATFSGLIGEYGQSVNNQAIVNFVRSADSQYNQAEIAIISVETSMNTNSTIDNGTIVLTFSTNVDAVAASNVANYFINGVVVEKASVRPDALNKVVLTLKANDRNYSYSEYLQVSNMKASGSIVTMPTSSHIVHLNENYRPQLQQQSIVRTDTDTILLRFTKPMKNVANNSFDITVAGQAVTVNHAHVSATDPYQIEIKLNQYVQKGQKISIRLNSSATVSDTSNNRLDIYPLAPIEIIAP